jgi:hypothetical protein
MMPLPAEHELFFRIVSTSQRSIGWWTRFVQKPFELFAQRSNLFLLKMFHLTSYFSYFRLPS